MNKAKTMLAAALAAGLALAQSDNAVVTQAATDPSTIHNAVAELSGITIQAFAAEVIDAIAAKPQSPVTTVLDLVDASTNFLEESDESNLADVLVALISNVPFEALPEWTARMYAAVQEATAGIEDASYNQLVVDVVGKIGDLDYTDEDKVVVTAFAIKLLSRGKDSIDDEPLKSALAAVPEGYKDQVAGSIGDVLSGDYSGTLAGVEITVVPEGAESEAGKTEGGEGTEGGKTEGETTEGGEGTEGGKTEGETTEGGEGTEGGKTEGETTEGGEGTEGGKTEGETTEGGEGTEGGKTEGETTEGGEGTEGGKTEGETTEGGEGTEGGTTDGGTGDDATDAGPAGGDDPFTNDATGDNDPTTQQTVDKLPEEPTTEEPTTPERPPIPTPYSEQF